MCIRDRENLRAGIAAEHAAEKNNPYAQWIGADIRADGFAYAAAGDPALAASLGYRDAYLTHRRNGIYGEMFFAAAEAAAFVLSLIHIFLASLLESSLIPTEPNSTPPIKQASFE